MGPFNFDNASLGELMDIAVEQAKEMAMELQTSGEFLNKALTEHGFFFAFEHPNPIELVDALRKMDEACHGLMDLVRMSREMREDAIRLMQPDILTGHVLVVDMDTLAQLFEEQEDRGN